MKQICFIFLMIISFASAKGDTIYVSQITDFVKLNSFKQVGIVEVNRADIHKNPTSLNFEPLKEQHITKRRKAYWLKVTIHNNLTDSSLIYFHTLQNDFAFLYESKQSILVKVATGGRMVPNNKLSVKAMPALLPVKLAKNQTTTYYCLVYNNHIDSIILDFSLVNRPDMILYYYKSDLSETSITLFFLGSFCFLSLFMLFMFAKSKQNIYLFFSLYLIGVVIYTFTRLSAHTMLGAWLHDFPVWRRLFSEPAHFLFFACYNLFVIELLDIKKQDRLLFKTLKYLAIFYIIYAFCYYTINYIHLDAGMRNLTFKIHRYFLFPVNILLIIRCAYALKSPVLKYFLTGIICFMLASLLAMYSAVILRETGLENVRAINIFQIGLMIEALCFAFALGHKIRLNEQEKTDAQNALILQLETNQQITEKANIELEEKVKQRTAQLLAANKQIEEKKAKEVKAYFDQKLAQAETMALRSQMNPHFLFNSLNSIKYLIQSLQNKLAIVYLTKFSKLVRMVLEHSRTELVSLAAEIEALKLYLEIESNRLGEQFTYQIKISRGISLDNVHIPPMLLQPFLENSIWHGLLNSNKPTKEVSLSITKSLKQKAIICTITDNGIGREKSAVLKQNITKHHQSFGTSLIFDRVKLFNQQYSSEIQVSIEDVIKDNETDGTKVLIYIYEAKNN